MSLKAGTDSRVKHISALFSCLVKCLSNAVRVHVESARNHFSANAT
jgi:hypothetical protein